MDRVWYVAYGSNLNRARFDVYVQGGRPIGGSREYPGCRDPRPPERDEAVSVSGGIRFVAESLVWGGGLAVYDAAAAGEIPARAYLLTEQQFVDVLAQEMRQEPGLDVDLEPVRTSGRHVLGPGRYQTLAHLGVRDEGPMLTFTSSDVEEDPLSAPGQAYLRTIAAGLRESHGWSPDRVGRYLAGVPGAAGAWSHRAIADLLVEGSTATR